MARGTANMAVTKALFQLECQKRPATSGKTAIMSKRKTKGVTVHIGRSRSMIVLFSATLSVQIPKPGPGRSRLARRQCGGRDGGAAGRVAHAAPPGAGNGRARSVAQRAPGDRSLPALARGRPVGRGEGDGRLVFELKDDAALFNRR